jgi:hypothetical protein
MNSIVADHELLLNFEADVIGFGFRGRVGK